MSRKRTTLPPAILELIQKPRRNKYGATITEVDGVKFHSRLEADYYRHLRWCQQFGTVERFHRQVIFDLGGGVKYVCDFLVIEKGGGIRYIDTKGFETAEFKRSKKLVKHLYGVEIEVVKKVPR